jgi:outer membrane lipoprotein-sorting protein
MRPRENIEKIIKEFDIDVNPAKDQGIRDEILQAHARTKQSKPAFFAIDLWRIIMRSRITKLGAAVVLLVAVVVGISQFGGSVDMATPVFAEVVRPLLDVETGSFKMTINVAKSDLEWINYGDEPVQSIEVLFSGPSRTRWNVPTGEVLVANMQYGKVMILTSDKTQATVMQVGPPGVIPVHNRFNKVFELRRLIEYALETESDSVEYLGEEQINGTAAIGYHVKGAYDHGDITIWANARTKVPIQIEQSIGAEKVVISEITYDIELDESLFSVGPPEEYSTGSSEEESQPPFVVRGTVTDAATGEPIAGVKVSDDGYGPKPYRSAITDSEGNYRYHTWAEEHNVKAEVSGFKAQHKGLTGLFHAKTEGEKVINFALERK